MTDSVVVVGDALLDVDVQTRADRLVPEAPVPVLEELTRHARPGGAALAAVLAARASGRPVVLVAGVSSDETGAQLRSLLPDDVQLLALPCQGSTAVKTRLLAGAQPVARLDRGCQPLTFTGLPAEAVAAIQEAAAVLVSDYGLGLTRHVPVRDALTERAARRPTVWDPHPRGGQPVPGLALVTPNGREASAASGLTGEDVGARRRQAEALRERWAARAVVITLASQGALLSYGAGAAELFPAPAVSGGDACGAGDCFAATVAAAFADHALPSEAVAAGVRAASAFVAGGAVAGLAAAASRGRSHPDDRSAGEVIAAVRARGGTVVATGGCFDLLHAGHIATLSAARSLGDCLVVCLNSDESVRRLKGSGRPLQTAADRARVLSSLRDVDAVLVFEEDTPVEAIRTLRPDIWVKGGDYAGAELPEARLVRSWGGEVVTVPYLAGRSTSQLVGLARR